MHKKIEAKITPNGVAIYGPGDITDITMAEAMEAIKEAWAEYENPDRKFKSADDFITQMMGRTMRPTPTCCHDDEDYDDDEYDDDEYDDYDDDDDCGACCGSVRVKITREEKSSEDSDREEIAELKARIRELEGNLERKQKHEKDGDAIKALKDIINKALG